MDDASAKVSRSEAIAFADEAFRNWGTLRLSDEDVDDMAAALLRFVQRKTATPQPSPHAPEVTDEMVERAKKWFDANFNGLPDTNTLVLGVLVAALNIHDAGDQG